MSVKALIERKVSEAMAVAYLQLENESHKHSVPANSETHFKLTLVSEAFEGMLPVRRHQTLYALLADELAGPVHALALHTYTPAEWAAAGQQSAASPDCLGGSKHDTEQ